GALTPSTSTSSTGSASTLATPETPGTDSRQRGGSTSRAGSGYQRAKTSPAPAALTAHATDSTAPETSLDATRVVAARVSSFASTTPSAASTPVAAITGALMPSTPAAAALAPPRPASVVAPSPPADPVSRLVSTLINTVLSPFANSAPTAPVQPPAAWTLLAFARREFGQAFST